MKIDILTLCDYAKIESGKLTIVDTLDLITAPKFPWRAYFGFAIKGCLKHEMAADGYFLLSIFSEDDIEAAGNDTLPDDSYLFHTKSPAIQDKGRFAIAGNIRGLIFNHPGNYIFRIKTSDGVTRDYHFSVKNNKEDDNG